jgi:protocatechuate 3,4-dioxygenase beta subunit
MTTSKAKVALALLLTAGLVLAGAAALARSAPAAGSDPGQQAAPQTAAPAPVAVRQPRAGDAKEVGQAANKTVVSGQVLGTDGKPCAGAAVALFGRAKLSPRGGHYRGAPKVIAEGKTDRDGKFRITADALTPFAYWNVSLIARAPGQGLGHHALPLDMSVAEVKLELLKERELRGRLVDLQGQPAGGVKVQLARIHGEPPAAKPFFLDCEHAPAALAYWPGPVTSDAQGRFTLRGLPAGCAIHLLVHGGEKIARQHLEVPAGGAPEKEVTLAVAPGRTLHGTVTYGDTGKPVPNARLRVLSVRREPTGGMRIFGMDAQADANGRFRVVPFNANSYAVAAYPPAGEPYLLGSWEVEWPRGVVLKQEVNLALRRGVRVVGSVKEASSGEPVAGAVVEFEPRYSNNPFFARDLHPRFGDLREVIKTGADGKFAMVVLPGPSHLLINGPTLDYVHKAILTRELFGPDIAPNRRYYPDGLVALDLKPGADTQRVEVTLQRGVTLKGRVLGPDGKPVASGHVFCRSYVPMGFTLNGPRGVPVKDGRFELPGWDPANPAPLYVLCPELGAGGVLRLKGGEGDKEPTIRLQKVGGAKVRVLDDKGKPLADSRTVVSLPISPGLSFFDDNGFGRPDATADEAFIDSVDHKTFGNLRTDADGRLELRGLIPGARHWIIVTRPGGSMVRVPVHLDAESGKTLDLKDVTLPLN